MEPPLVAAEKVCQVLIAGWPVAAGGVRCEHLSFAGAWAQLPGSRLSQEVPNGSHDPFDFSRPFPTCVH